MKEFLSRKGIAFKERDLTRDPSAIEELRKMNVMATPATVVDGHVVTGFDEQRLNELLGAQARKAS